MSDLGLPSIPSPHAAPQRPARTCYEYDIPQDAVSEDFFEKFTEADLTFSMTEPTPAAMEQAGKVAGQNAILLAKEMLFSALHKIGEMDARSNRDSSAQRGTDGWWVAIGPKGRDLVNQEFVDLIQPSKEQVDRFRGSRRVKRG